MVSLELLKQGVNVVIAKTKCGISSDTLYRLGLSVVENCPEGERNYRDNYELISPIPYPIQYVPSCSIPVCSILRILLYQDYFGNFPSYELPPICYTHLWEDFTKWNRSVNLEMTLGSVARTMCLVEKPSCSDEELYKAIYSITAIRNELSLQACKLLDIRWEPQVSIINKCFYMQADTPQRAWQADCNVLQANFYAFTDDFLRFAYATRVFSEWSKENPESTFKVSPISILNMTEKDFNRLPGIGPLYSSTKTKSNSELIVLRTLDRFCRLIQAMYQRITQVDIQSCTQATVYGKTKWLMQLIYKLTVYIVEQ